MTGNFFAASWVTQSPERLTAIHLRSHRLITATVNAHLERLLSEWAANDDGPLPSRQQAEAAARHELEVLCRWIGRFGALEPHEVFPRLARFTTPDNFEGW